MILKESFWWKHLFSDNNGKYHGTSVFSFKMSKDFFVASPPWDMGLHKSLDAGSAQATLTR